MNNLKNIIIAVIIALGLGYSYGRYMQPARVEVQEKVNIVKETEVVYREIKQADGTVIKETITKDTAKKESDKSSKTTAAKTKYLLSGIISYDFTERKESFGGAAQVRIGDTPFFGGVVYKDNSTGLILTIEL
jgi:hypothetical protein